MPSSPIPVKNFFSVMAFNRAKRVFDSFCRNSRSRISDFSLRSPHSPKLCFPVCSKGNRYNTIYERFRRFRGRDEDDKFYMALGPWRFLLSAGVLVLGVVFHANSEYVPFWERIHFLNLSRNMELKIGKSAFKMVKRDRQALPATDPSSLRVKSISQDIIEALQRGLARDEQAGSDFRHDASTENKFGEETLGQTCDSNEILDDKRIEQSIKNQQKKSESIPNFEGIQWEVLVVDDPSVHAACLPGGKIIVFSGALKQYATDAELATMIAREVGHVVGRHTKVLWAVTLQLGVYEVIKKCITVEFDSVKKTLDFFWRNLLSWKIDLEADKIAVLLMASAGYDPQVAVGVCKGFDDKVEKGGWLAQIIRDYLVSWTHPAGKKRAERLAQAKEMEDALIVYRGKNSTKA